MSMTDDRIPHVIAGFAQQRSGVTARLALSSVVYLSGRSRLGWWTSARLGKTL